MAKSDVATNVEASNLPDEVAAFAEWREAEKQARPLPPVFEIEESEGGSMMLSHAGGEDLGDYRLMACMKLRSHRAAEFLLQHIGGIFQEELRKGDLKPLNAAMALLDEIRPEGGLQSMLAAQMVATHVITMDCAKRANHPNQTFAGRELNLKFLTKLTNNFARQTETLDKLRRGGSQKMTVEHVHVNEGGQAIVGNVG